MKKFSKFNYYCPSPKCTLKIGKEIGKRAQVGDVILLIGELGVGKTWLTKGIAEGLGVAEEYPITSPTFVFVQGYKGRLPLYHIDLYRIERGIDFSILGVEEYIFGDGVTVIEWAEKLPNNLIPSKFLKIQILFANKGRKLEFITNIAHFKAMRYDLKKE
ncbi:MAG TPA: tRNA (adenosine(37)-N6)-threonylcarbamoyltransferase complex ATPase subunit type 1 TsaE [Thermoplasmatales archaeon]|nr:tRNA (adenosine(37)-N6)-threonylcarbamoyltransferase complex ATPase subunit type 1 TsaE [Thermoplasmatales archaeon]